MLLALSGALSAQHLVFQPERPMPGETIQFRYDPAGAPLEGAERIYATVLLFNGKMPEAIDVELKPAGAHFTGEVAAGADAKALFVKLENEAADKTDSNQEKGYWAMFYQAGRSAPVQGACAGIAQGLNSFSNTTGVKRDQEQALEYYRQEFRQFPASKTDVVYATDFASLAAQTKDEAALADARATAAALAGSKKATEADLNMAYYMYQRMGDEEPAKELGEKIKKKYPAGRVSSDALVTEFFNERDLSKKETLFETYRTKFSKDEGFQSTLNNLARSLANGYAARKDWGKFTHCLALMDDRQAKASILNNLAWEMAGEGLAGEAPALEQAAQFSRQSLELMEEAMEKPGEGKPSFYGKRFWKSILEGNYGMYADTYAVIRYRQGGYEDALHYQTIACENRGFSDGELNERYAIYLEKVKGGKAAEKKLAAFIADGNASGKMKEQHKRLFMEHNSLEDAYGLYVAELEKEAQEKFREETRKKMIDEEAPDFALRNLSGEEVQLSSLRGKTVVLDFWATWCGPCIASFPGMQRAVNHYQDDKSVVFLFIDTWENGENKEKNAGDFMKSKGYNFEVLMDNDNKVVAKYGVRGIPTKFVIGPEGRIRFRSMGFGGNDEALLTEMQTMIDMTKAEGGKAMP